jgi:hypothetical protein
MVFEIFAVKLNKVSLELDKGEISFVTSGANSKEPHHDSDIIVMIV